MKILKITFLFLFLSITMMAQKTITFDLPNNKMIYTDIVNGQTVIKNYAIGQCFFVYEATINRISLYFNAANKETIYSGSFSQLKVSGKTATAEKLAELNQKLSIDPGSTGGTGSSGGTTIINTPTYTLTTVTARNGETNATYTIPSTATYWTVCNVGNQNATLRDGTSNEDLILRPGQCAFDEIKFRIDTNQAIRVSAITITATGTVCTYRWK